MEESTIIMDPGAIARGQCESALETILREGGRRLLQEALELEVQQYIERFQQLKSESGQGLVVRNGYHQERELVTGAGKVPVRQPRVHDRRPTERFTSAILPPYLRRTPSIDALIPALYLKGVSTSAFPEALQAILGDGVVGLSANNVVRLKQVWEQEFQAWSKRDLHGKRYVYLWADAVYFNVRLQKDRPCVLVVVGATEDGHKELLAIQDGERESHLSWLHLLQDLKARGLKEHSFLAVADGALGFWKALEEALPGGLRPLPGPLPGQISQGLRVSAQGPRRDVCLLRFPGRPLGAPTNDQPDRIDLRHGPPSHAPDQSLWLTRHGFDHGLQTGNPGRKALASSQQLSTHHPSRRWRHLHRR